MRQAFRNKVVILTLVLGLLAVLVIVFLLFSEFREGLAIADSDGDIRENLIREIAEYEPNKDTKVRTSAPRVSGKVKPKQQGTTKNFVHSPLPNTYSVVSVVPELKKEKFERDQTKPVANASIELEHLMWMTSPSAIDDLVSLAGEREQTYGWMQITRPVNLSEMRRSLREFDATVLGTAGDLVRLRVPNDREDLVSILNLSWVSGIGALPTNQKVSQSFREEIDSSSSSEQFPVFISVMDSDPENEFRQALEEIGVSVGHFDPSIRVFAAVVAPGQFHEVISMDFVQAIEPISEVTATHDTAVPAQGVDKLRTIGDLSGTFSGFTGTSTPIAVMDSGLNTNHVDISTFRESICAKNFVDGEDSDLFFDANGHGTHVTGTVVGNGFFVPKYAGMAPGVQHIRFAKVLNRSAKGQTLDIHEGMDFLAEESSCILDGQETAAVRALIVNMSLSYARLNHDSRSTAARKLDSIVWTHRQLYVVSNANSNQHGYSDYAAAKNSLPVGVSYDMGDIHGMSSQGPTIDNRMTPLVTGTGASVWSASGRGSFDNYSNFSGTSMASPSVAGLATLLMDASPEHREQPALVRARLMASAVRPDGWIESESQFPKNNTNGPGEIQSYYGMGMVSATATILNNDSEHGWISSGAAVEMENDEYAYQDIEVPEGASRLDVVMTWDEPPTDSISNNVLNDLDLWVDLDADCGNGPCGEHSSLSRIDNVEWVIIEDPEPGTYRLKIAAHSVYSDAPRAAIAWTIIRGDSTPQLAIEASEEIYETPIGEDHSHVVDLTISTDSYIAKGVSLHIDCRTLDGEACPLGRLNYSNTFIEREHTAIVQRSDGLGVAQVGEHFVLGEVTEGNPTNVLLELYAQTSEPMRVYAKVMTWNGRSHHTSFLIRPAGSIDEISVAITPSNDNFDNPMVLEDANGSQEIDLLVSSMEDGEPLHENARWKEARAAGSVWFQRTATEPGRVSFVVTPTNRGFSDRKPKVQVYQTTDSCCGMTGARLLASSYWSAQLLAREGTEYRIRVSVSGESLPLSLNWYQGARPINDTFANAIELSGESGEISGNNLGATLEVGELYGDLASTVWYHWTAPDDGEWEFQIEDSEVVHLLVFVGDDVADLRLVSNFRNVGEAITLNAKKNQTYRIMVASPNAYYGGWVYDALSWRKVESLGDRNDMFADAFDLEVREIGGFDTSHDNWPGIEPDEPEVTGVQSRWWKWEAPSDGQFTFLWSGEGKQIASAFTGSTIDQLQTAMLDNSLTSETDFVVGASQGETYYISVGREKFASYAFYRASTKGRLLWGPTPTNNTVQRAAELVGEHGETNGSTLYATTEQDEWALFGISSMWYSHQVEEAGWVRFWVESSDSDQFRIAAFTRSGEEAELDFVMASRRNSGQRDHVMEVYVYIEQGMQVVLRVAIDARSSREDFTLRWQATDAPNWLTYVGRLSYGRRDEGGSISRISGPAEISFSTDGTAVYVTTQGGLHAYHRNTDSGGLTLSRVYEEIPVESHHFWDPYRSKLHINNLSRWWTYSAASDDHSQLELVDSFEEENWIRSRHEIGVRTMGLGGNGDYLYRFGYFEQWIYDFSTDGNVQYYGKYRDPQRSVYASNDEYYWYGLDYSKSQVSKSVRIPGSPFFERMSETSVPSWGRWFIGNDYSNTYTFVATTTDFRVYDNQSVGDQFTNLITQYNLGREMGNCGRGYVRKDRYVVDFVCDYGGYVVKYDPDTNAVYVTDKIVGSHRDWIPDRFGRSVPHRFALWKGDGVSASPDGRHIYASTRQHGILIFERYGNDVIHLQDASNLPKRRLDLLQIADGVVQFGEDSINEGCFESNTWTVNDVTYTIASSRWQERENGSKWSDIDGTNVAEQLCLYASEENREYRVVADIEIDGELREYSSNYFARVGYVQFDDLEVSSGEIELNNEYTHGCMFLSDTDIGGKNYTVFNSKWQSRPDAESVWSDVDGTETSGELCALDAEEGLEYRLVGSVMVDGERGHRRSNVMQLESSE